MIDCFALSLVAKTLQMVEGRDNTDIPASVAFCQEKRNYEKLRSYGSLIP